MSANPDDKLTMAMDVRVKALVWSQPKAGMALLKGDGAIRYTVAQVGYQWGWKPEWGAGTVVDSEFSAKAAAQADYTARVLSALEPSPSAERMREALQRAESELMATGPVPTHDTYGDRRRLMLATVKALHEIRTALTAIHTAKGTADVAI